MPMKKINDLIKKEEEKKPQKKEGLSKILMGEIKPDKCKIFIINGEFVRNNIDVNFVEGGHHYRYNYIAEDEIWIEDTGSSVDTAFNAAHEITERIYMKNQKMKYDSAHNIATSIEETLRNIKIGKF
jgi:hypothetical protein